jgi:hypothetical protein
MADDIHAIVTAHWKAVIESEYQCPIFTADASPQTRLPYAVAEHVMTNVPMGRGRTMATVDTKVAVYATSDRTIEAIAAACGLNSKVPTGFNREEIGTATMRATSVVSGGGLIKDEQEPPFGGGKCRSRILMFKIRMGAK